MIRIEVSVRPGLHDPMGEADSRALRKFLSIPVQGVRVVRVYTIDGDVPPEVCREFAASALADPVSEIFTVDEPVPGGCDWICEVSYRPGVTDNEGRTATEALRFMYPDAPVVYFAKQYRLTGGNLTREDVEKAAAEYFANQLIQSWSIVPGSDAAIKPYVPKVTSAHEPTVNTYSIDAPAEKWSEWSTANVWALKPRELEAILSHFRNPAVQQLRTERGLPRDITDVEIECIAQSWSEHCKHKIFSSEITYTDERGETRVIDGLFKTYIRGATERVRQLKGEKDQCLSVFTDNAGVVSFNEDWALVFKVETHNSPSALDPYGGALTGIVGVNRDPFGTGMGANLLFNTDVFCLADPYTEDVPDGLLHPLRILEGVRLGVEHGGNQSGIPTVNGSVLFHQGYLGKPVIYAGTGAFMPRRIAGREAYRKYPEPGHAIVMVGGRIGKDGIHGATFSSEELSGESPSSAVQIGDPITQKRMFDFLLMARDRGLYSAITDNGAGGLSSSVGEMATMTGGARLDLSKPLLKYHGLDPWEILVSESQERMTVAVPQENLNDFLKLAQKMRVEATHVGEFTDTGYFELEYDGRLVGLLDLEFLHDGVPRMHLEVRYEPRQEDVVSDGGLVPVDKALPELLGSLNIASKEYWVRQYDHEVKGGSVVKPLVGAEDDGPSDGAVWRPFLDSYEGVVVAHGIVPRYSEIDARAMAQAAFDEAVRNAVAVGGDPETFSALDNFAWPDPLPGAPDWEWKLASLVRTNEALYEMCEAYEIPLISGKDSMKNDARLDDGTWISIPPTLLVSLIGRVPDVRRAVTMDVKAPGHWVYIIGMTRRELGASEYAIRFSLNEYGVPRVDNPAELFNNYKKLHKAIASGLVSAVHDLSDGGLGVAAAEMAFAGRLGMELDLGEVPADGTHPDSVLMFSESQGRLLVTVSPRHARRFEKIMTGTTMARIGLTVSEPVLTVQGSQGTYGFDVHELHGAWKRPLAL